MSTLLSSIKNMKYSQREVDFILYNWSLINDEVDCPNNLSYLKYFFEYCLEEKKKIIDPSFLQKHRFLMNNEVISWFKDDLRAGLFLYAFIYFNYGKLNINLRVYGDFLKDIVISIDCSHEKNYGLNTSFVSQFFNSRSKALILKQALQFYGTYKTKPKDLNWLSNSDREQLDWATEYLQELGLLIQPFNFLASDAKENYLQICASIDALDLHTDLSSKINKTKDEKLDAVDTNMYLEGEIFVTPIIGQNFSHSNSGPVTQHANSTTPIKEDNLPKLVLKMQNPFHTGFENSELKVKILKNMRNAWNQKVFRDKKPVKSEKQLKLPYGYNKKLGEIAEAYDENMVDCLKQILDKEYDDVVPHK